VFFGDAPPDALASYPGFLLVFLGSRQGRRMREALEPLGVHPRDFGVMTLVASRPGSTQQQLSDLSGIDRSSMVAVLDDLEEQRLAERRPDPSDRRKRSIHLTAKGRRVLEQSRREGARLQEELMADLTPGERDELLRLLRKLAGTAPAEPSPDG
jgi:DNA-binding MarR family transcriptional regulator